MSAMPHLTPCLRPFEDADYSALAALGTAVYPDHPETADELRLHDRRYQPPYRHGRWVAEVAGRVVGAVSYSQPPDSYHPQRFWLDVSVHPDHRGRGLGSRLYDLVTDHLAPFEPIKFVTMVFEPHAEARRFVERRGFVEEIREWESRLDLTTFDATLYAGWPARLAEPGLVVRTLTELADDPRRDAKLHQLEHVLNGDMPSPDPVTPVSLDRWREDNLNNPNLLPDGWKVAVDTRADNRYVGLSSVWASQAEPGLNVGLTGVVRDHRRRGIALALKVAVAEWAQAQGYPAIKTWNATTNDGMLAINTRLGFVRQPAWIGYGRHLR